MAVCNVSTDQYERHPDDGEADQRGAPPAHLVPQRPEQVRADQVAKDQSEMSRFVSTEKAPTRAFSWLKAATTAFTFKTLLRHYAKRALTPRSLNVGWLA